MPLKITDNQVVILIININKLRQPFNTNGDIQPTQISKFDITWP